MGEPDISVEACPGYKGEETPRRLIIDGSVLEVSRIIDHWYTDTHSYFRLETADRQRYVVRHHADENRWEPVMQEHDSEVGDGPLPCGPSR